MNLLDDVLFTRADAVAHLALEITKAENREAHFAAKDIEGNLPEAWRILRTAALIVSITGRGKTCADYEQLALTPPPSLVSEVGEERPFERFSAEALRF